jgi:hypothetical protein
VTRIVVGIALGEVRVVHAWLLVEEAAAPTARHRVEAGDGEGAIRCGPQRVGLRGAAEKARGVDGRKPHERDYFLEMSQCPTAR